MSKSDGVIVTKVTITKAQLEAAMLSWERTHRAGGTLPYDEAKTLPPEQVARNSADHLWDLLCAPGGSRP